MTVASLQFFMYIFLVTNFSWCCDPLLVYDFSTQTHIPPNSTLYRYNIHETKQLVYFAVRHTNDFDGTVCRTIKSLIEDERPDVCIIEGMETRWGYNPESVIKIVKGQSIAVQYGENVYTAQVCFNNSVDFIGGEVNQHSYVSELAKYDISLEDVVYFMLAQQIPFWHRDNRLNKDNLKEQFETFMKEPIKHWLGIPTVEYTFEDFLVYHQKNTGTCYEPENTFIWDYTSTELMPYLGADAIMYQKVAARINHLRDWHIVEVITSTLKKYNKVLVIYGASHYEWQEKNLNHLFGQPYSSLVIE